MAYRFNGSTDYMEFALAPLSGYTFGAFTFAAFIKRAAVSSGINETLGFFADSALTSKLRWRITTLNRHDVFDTGAGTNEVSPSTQLLNSTTPWYLLAVTRSTGALRFHLHDGTSWAHGVSVGGPIGSTALVSGDRLRVGQRSGSEQFNGDVACIGIKKADSADAAIEGLSRTAFSAWTGFGFDWLIGFDSGFVSGGLLQDQASPGTGDQTAISGTSVVSDPPGWSWSTVTAPAFVPKIIITG